jgi:hypothetical protein
MKRLLLFAARLYPFAWRRRYGNEFEALLEDVSPGWREVLDVFAGALTMQIKAVGALPVFGAVTGALAGMVIAMSTPQLFASSATFLLASPTAANRGAAVAKDVEAALQGVVGDSTAMKQATSVHLEGEGATTLVLSYQSADPQEAKRVADSLAAAIAEHGGTTTFKLLEAPSLATNPVSDDRGILAASGGGVGLLAGAIIRLVRARRRTAGTV